ncbi:MAG: AAA family ATPase [Halanaerobiales bacterium]|nr:AAA family ATPase [Halanaerobiales bacterium]
MNDYRNKLKKYNEFILKLEKCFQTNDYEWVDVYTTPSGRVDITIVSDKFLNRNESTAYIEQCFKDIDNYYRRGFSNFYTVEDAEMLEIEKPEKKQTKNPTWENAALNYLNQETNEICEDPKHSSKVISFYSYKGGVGRTVALIQVAYLLAKKGKKVLLIDLDIEAPSLFDIFREKIDVKYGLVDYLYEQMMVTDAKDRKLDISDIFTDIKFDETLKGNLYVVPSGLLSPEYVYKLKQLQPNFVSQKDYLNDLIVEFEKNLNLDIVLIDSRTGLNDWGAFSLMNVADDIIFFAYPNQENVQGLQLVVDLMKGNGCKNLTMAFSRIDPDGIEKAKELFEKLQLEQEFISILYNPRIATADQYPIIEALDEYKELADFILEDENRERNKFYLNTNKSFLKRIKSIQIENVITELEEKVHQDNVWFIVGEKKY